MAEAAGDIAGPINAETGDVSQFTGTTIDSGMTFDASTDADAHGTYGFRVVGNGTGNDARGHVTISDQTVLYARAYVYIDPDMTIASTGLGYVLALWDGATELVAVGFHRNAADPGVPDIWRSTGTSLANSESATNFSLGEWHYIELYWIAGTGANGGAVIYVDGDQIFSELNNDLTAYACDTVRLGLYNAVIGSGDYIYLDDLKVNTTGPIGEYSEAGGTTYNEACADGVAVNESATPTACIFGVSAADGVGIDELTGGTAIMPSAAADGVEAQDAATSLAELLAAAADSVTVTGAASSIATFLRAAADSVALQDLATTIATFLVQAADGVVVDDAASVAALGVIEVLAADGVAVDDAAAAVASLQVTCIDSVTVDDLTTATFRIVAVSADGVEVNDAVTVVATMAAAAADSVSVQDAAAALCTFLVQALDGVALQDVAVSTSGALASGRVTVTFSTKRGSVSITAKRAAVTITPKVPKLTLS